MTTTLILAMVAAVLVAVLGTVFVGGPMRRLTEKARRVGARRSDRAAPPPPARRDR